MSQLYGDLAEVYHEMYQGIFDYKQEYDFYNNILQNNNVTINEQKYHLKITKN